MPTAVGVEPLSRSDALLRQAFFLTVVRPVVLVGLGLNVRRRHLLPRAGPAIVVANHNSHLDAAVLSSLFPLRFLPRVRPVAAADYFLSGNRALAWFATRMMGILPLERTVRRGGPDPLAPCEAALARGEVLILFPEGTRGEPEERSELRGGVSRLVERCPDVPVTPVFLHGLGKSLPKGAWLPVPLFCDVFVGEELRFGGRRAEFFAELKRALDELASEGEFAPWT